MADTPYTYSIANDFPSAPNGPATDRLQTEIQSSDIVLSLRRISTAADDCKIWFSGVLSTTDQSILDAIVSTHTGEPLEVGTPVTLVDAIGEGIPTTSDHRPIFAASRLGIGVDPYICGRGDDRTTKTKGAGDIVEFSWGAGDTDLEKEVQFGFLDVVQVAAGGMIWEGGKIGDRIDMWVTAQPTPSTNTPGAGSANKVAVGPGKNIYIPAPLNDGDWTINTTPTSYAEAPKVVPNLQNMGYWDWVIPDEGLGAGGPTPNPLDPKGYWDLYDFEIKLVHWVCAIPIIGAGGQYIDPNSIDRRIYPQWNWHVRVSNESQHEGLTVGVYLNLARASTI